MHICIKKHTTDITICLEVILFQKQYITRLAPVVKTDIKVLTKQTTLSTG